MFRLLTASLPAAAVLALAAPVPPKTPPSWPMFGGTPGRNMGNFTDHGPPDAFDPEKGTNILWKADLGSRCHTQPVVAGGRVFVGTNNDCPRNLRDTKKNAQGVVEPIDRGVLMCFRASDGKFLWQAVHDKLPGGVANDWPHEGIASSPAVAGDRVYYVSNRAEVVCADVAGFADGNQGFRGEKYADATDADIIWSFDMIRELGVFPHSLAACAPLIVGDALFVVTGNGVNEQHVRLPAPDAPSFIALDRRTGRLLWKDNSPGRNVMHAQWSGPAYAAGPVPQVIFPGGDGWLRAFDPPTGKLLWKFDGNPKDSKYEVGGGGTRSDFIGYPVVSGGRLYIGTGQDPEHYTGIAHFWCLDLAKAVEFGRRHKDRDVSPVGDNFDPKAEVNRHSALAWHFGREDKRKFAYRDFVFGRTLSTACVVGDVVYVAELMGYLHCLDARTGEKYWGYDTRGAVWSSPYYCDGKVYLGTTRGDLFVFRHMEKPASFDDLNIPDATDRKDFRRKRRAIQKAIGAKCVIAAVEFDAGIKSAVSVAGGVLYVATEKSLYAVGKK